MTRTESPRTDLGIALDYYSPYVSGLTEVARVVAEGLAGRGWRVEVVCGAHDRSLPAREVLNGVTVQRASVVGRAGKALVQPAFPLRVAQLARRSSVVNLHLPLPEGLAAPLWRSAPLVATYQCDAWFTPGPLGQVQRIALDAASRAVLRRSRAVIVTSEDYLQSSRIRSAVTGDIVAIPPPVRDRPGGTPRFRRSPGAHIGFLGRIVEEKGLEPLVQAVRGIDDPDLRLLIAGGYDQVAGGSVVDRVRSAIGGDPRIELLGFLPDEDVADFLASLDVFALPSVNSLEAFGIVQVEAMLAGVPVVASDLPGVRLPVQELGIGRLAPPGDVAGLRAALVGQLGTAVDRDELSRRTRQRYGQDRCLDAYAEVLEAAMSARRSPGGTGR